MKKLKDRKDAKRVDAPMLMQCCIDLKPNRHENEVYINHKVDVTNLVNFINEKKKQGIRYTYFHAFLTAIAKAIYNRPKLNRFILNRHLYEHNSVVLSFVAKTTLVCGKKFQCKPIIEIEDLKTLPMLFREKGSTSRDYIENICKKEYITMNTVMESVSNNAIINMAIANYRIAILPKTLIKSYLQNRLLKEISIHGLKLSRSTMIIWHKNKKFLNEQKEIFDYCCNVIPSIIEKNKNVI